MGYLETWLLPRAELCVPCVSPGSRHFRIPVSSVPAVRCEDRAGVMGLVVGPSGLVEWSE